MLKNNFIAWYYALWMAKVLENVLRGIICSFEVNNWSNLWRYWNQMFALFPAAIFVLLRRAQIWRPHSEPYKFLLHILKNNSAAENCTDLTRFLIYRYSIISEVLSFRHSTFQLGFALKKKKSKRCPERISLVSIECFRNTKPVQVFTVSKRRSVF